ncbi:MAG: hypothetical protein AAFV33_00295 [Chloroflexota bacterium]
MRRTSRARIAALVVVNLLLLARLIYLIATREPPITFPPLEPEQVIERDDLNARTCTRAILLAANPDAEPADEFETAIAPDYAARVADVVLAAYFERRLGRDVIVHEPLLVTADVFGEERLIWGRMWLPPDEDGNYDDAEVAIVYVDARAAVPLLIYTDARVRDPQAEGCFLPQPADYRRRYEIIAPLLFATALTLIFTGVYMDRREREANSKLQNSDGLSNIT